MNNTHSCQQRFLELLCQLTKSGHAIWAQSRSDPGFVYCLAGQDLIVFEVRSGTDAALVCVSQRGISGIVAKCRNVSFLWLEGVEGWSDLVKLLYEAPDDEKEFIKMRRVAQQFPVLALEALLSK